MKDFFEDVVGGCEGFAYWVRFCESGFIEAGYINRAI